MLAQDTHETRQPRLTLISIVDISSQGKAVLDALEQLNLEYFLLPLHDINCSIPELVRESVVDLCTGEEERFYVDVISSAIIEYVGGQADFRD